MLGVLLHDIMKLCWVWLPRSTCNACRLLSRLGCLRHRRIQSRDLTRSSCSPSLSLSGKFCAGGPSAGLIYMVFRGQTRLLEKKGFDAKTPTRDLGQAADNPTACTATPGRKAGPLRSLRARSGRARAFSSGCRFGEWFGTERETPIGFSRRCVCRCFFWARLGQSLSRLAR